MVLMGQRKSVQVHGRKALEAFELRKFHSTVPLFTSRLSILSSRFQIRKR